MLTTTQVTWTVEQKQELLERARVRFGRDAYFDDTDVVVGDRTVATVMTELHTGDHILVVRRQTRA